MNVLNEKGVIAAAIALLLLLAGAFFLGYNFPLKEREYVVIQVTKTNEVIIFAGTNTVLTEGENVIVNEGTNIDREKFMKDFDAWLLNEQEARRDNTRK